MILNLYALLTLGCLGLAPVLPVIWLVRRRAHPGGGPAVLAAVLLVLGLALLFFLPAVGFVMGVGPVPT